MGEFLVILVAAAFVISCGVQSDASDHRYKAGDLIPCYVSRTGPFNNPSEIYGYYGLPFCHPGFVNEKKQTLRDIVTGDQFITAPYKLEFQVNGDYEVVCEKNLTKEEVFKFQDAIAKDYYIQMYCDDMPIWTFIGSMDINKKRYFLYMHIEFNIYYNKEHLIEISARTGPSDWVELIEEREVPMKLRYTVTWKETSSPFEKRIEKYFGYSSSPYLWEIRWFSILNSCVTILFLTGWLSIYYMRILKKDLERFHDEELVDNQDEMGWKFIHGDVFRYPHHKSLFAAAVGSGTQLFALTTVVLILGMAGAFHPYKQGYLFIALMVTYALTSAVAGYTSAYFYGQLEGTKWVRNLLLTGLLFCGPLFATFCILNTVAIVYKTTAAFPTSTIVFIFLIWMLVALPLFILGGIAGKNCKAEFQAPCRTTRCPKPIPPLRWYRGSVPQMALAGYLPFGVMFNELGYIFASAWGHNIYSVYGFLILLCTLLLITTALVTVALTYFQLAAEDYRWWWRSFLCGGSVGLYVYGYCLYFYSRSYLSGFLQLSFFFGYMACICYAIFLMLGMVGFFTSLLFVRYIYGSIKCD